METKGRKEKERKIMKNRRQKKKKKEREEGKEGKRVEIRLEKSRHSLLLYLYSAFFCYWISDIFKRVNKSYPLGFRCIL